jgi:ABC-type sulfate/molybdate transport systems ATPase subunit
VQAEVSCPEGQVLAVSGPNGAGKSSLLRALAGVDPSTGEVEVRGRSMAGLPPYRREVGWVPQQVALLPHLSARDNAAYALRARGVRRRPARERAQAWLERLGIGELGDVRPAALSGGQAARVALARALVHEPALLLLDEPFVAVDVPARAAVREQVREAVRATRCAALLVTHDPLDLEVLADGVLRLEGGRPVVGPH